MFVIVFQQLLKMFLIMALGFICYKIRLVNQEGNKNLSNLLLMVVTPCLILTSYQVEYDPRLAKGLLISFGLAIMSHVVAILISLIAIPGKENQNQVVERYAVVYANCGFIGIPLINSIMGAEGVFYLTAYVTVFNILNWTYGLVCMRGSVSAKAIREGLTSSTIITILVSIVLFFLNIRLPKIVLDAAGYVADMNTPLAMIVAGLSIAQADLKKILRNLRIYWICFLKLLAVPLITLLFLALLPVDSTLAYTTLIGAACPTGTVVTMMSIRYNKDYVYASEIFSFSTLLSIVTVPLIVLIAGFVL